MLEVKQVCIIENPRVRADFLEAYRKALQDKGYQADVIPEGSSLGACPVTSKYVAYWAWDLVLYMTSAQLDVYRDGRPAGRALFRGEHLGAAGGVAGRLAQHVGDVGVGVVVGEQGSLGAGGGAVGFEECGGGGDGVARLWEPSTGQLVASLRGHVGGVTGVALSADSQLLATGGDDGTVRLWQPAAGKLLAILEGHTGAVWGVALSADGRLVASGGADRTARVWEASTGRLVATLVGHSGLVRAVALSADGRVVASGSMDGTLRAWEAAGGRLIATLAGHSGLIRAVALTSDGRLLASGSIGGTLRFWDVSSNTLLRTLRGDRRYERMDISGLTGVTQAQREAMLALGALDGRSAP